MLHKISDIMDKIVVKQGKATAMLMPLLVVVTGIEVFRRYVLQAPSVWGLEFTTFLFGINFILGFSYTEHFDGHVNVDLLTSRLTPKNRTMLWLAATLLLSLPTAMLLLYGAIVYAYESVEIFERNSTAWSPAIWPVKLFMPIAFFFLLIQLVSNIIKKFQSLKTDEKGGKV